ncbi:MAG: CHAT domain-containing protein [Spirulinaceae cyanobacterium]
MSWSQRVWGGLILGLMVAGLPSGVIAQTFSEKEEQVEKSLFSNHINRYRVSFFMIASGGGAIGEPYSAPSDSSTEPDSSPGTESDSEQQTEATKLFRQGYSYYRNNDHRGAIRVWEEALSIYQKTNDLTGEANTLNSIGTSYLALGEYSLAHSSLNTSLRIYREIGNENGEANSLNDLCLVDSSISDFLSALEYCELALSIYREIENEHGEANSLNNIGITHWRQGNYQVASEFLRHSLDIYKNIEETRSQAQVLGNLGIIRRSLGSYQESIDFFREAFSIYQESDDIDGQAQTILNLADTYYFMQENRRAIELYEQSLVLQKNIEDSNSEANSLNGLGGAYRQLGSHLKSIDFYEESLEIYMRVGDRFGEADSLNGIGESYLLLGKYNEAFAAFQKALGIRYNIGDNTGTAKTLTNIGRLFAAQNQPEVAIIFLKESVRTRETIRTDNRQLDAELRQSYITTIEDDYRFLAELLLDQARIPEAQQVLDLLKLQELRDFTNTRASFTSDGEIAYTDPEQAVLDDHNSLIALGTEILDCEDSNCADLDQLYDQLEGLKAQYDEQVAGFIATIRANRANDDLFQNLDNLSSEAEDLLLAYNQAGQNTVLIYPFVLEDKLWLVWAAAGGVIGSIEVPVSQAELAQTVHRLGRQLQIDSRNVGRLQSTSQKLYDWIIKPLESELDANEIEHLVFVNDRVTRYIPMAALFDGEQYLLENYQISTVLTPALTDTRSRLDPEPQVLGMGLTDAVAGFNPLPAVKDELDAIVTQGDDPGVYPGQVLLNEQFTLDSLKRNVSQHQILHLATHAAFVPGRAEASYIVLGDGDSLNIPDIEAMERRLRNLHLVVLSACQTALGGQAGDGTEIAGLSSYFLETGRAETVLASLWLVNDQSTSLLMQRFYALLATGVSKTEALRQAQLSLLYQEEVAEFEARMGESGVAVAIVPRNGNATATAPGFSSPYYWAPFILIGNGL